MRFIKVLFMLKNIFLLIVFIIISGNLKVFPQNFASKKVSKQESIASQQAIMDTIIPPEIKPNFMVNSLGGDFGAVQQYVSSALAGNGSYACTWLDYRNGKNEVYAQFFNSNDEKLKSNINVFNFVDNNYSSVSPVIAANKTGKFVIGWVINNNQLLIQQFNANGERIENGVIYQMNNNIEKLFITVAADGGFMVTYFTNVSYPTYQIFMQLFSDDGRPITSENLVAESNLTGLYYASNIAAVDDDQNYMITWKSKVNDDLYIYVQKYNRYGNKIGVPLKVNDNLGVQQKNSPAIESTYDGYSCVVWQSLQYSDDVLLAKIISPDQSMSEEIILAKSSAAIQNFGISSDKDSIFYVSSNINGNYYFYRLNKSGEKWSIPTSIKVNIDSIYNIEGNFTNFINNYFYYTFSGYAAGDENIYIRKYENLQPVESLVKINDDKFSSIQNHSSVKFNSFGESIVLWEDARNGRRDLYAQAYDKDFNPVGENILVNNNTSEYWTLKSKEVRCFSDGTFVIAYNGGVSSKNEIIIQTINTSGEKVGDPVKVDEVYSNYDYQIAFNINPQDELFICYYNAENACIKKYKNDLTQIDEAQNIISSANSKLFVPFSVSVDSVFNVFAVWEETDKQQNNYSYHKAMKGLFFNEKGKPASDTLFIDTTFGNAQFAVCRNEGHDYALAFGDGYRFRFIRSYKLDSELKFKNDYNIYSQNVVPVRLVDFKNRKAFLVFSSYNKVLALFLNDNIQNAKLFKVHEFVTAQSYPKPYNFNNADYHNGSLFYTYEENKNDETNLNIWAAVEKVDEVNFEKEFILNPSKSDELFSNYPNPFNSTTKIVYQILAYHKVKLAVYDILGREVKVLVNENKERGVYEVEFNASGLASGIYFCRLEAFKTRVKKMLLLK